MENYKMWMLVNVLLALILMPNGVKSGCEDNMWECDESCVADFVVCNGHFDCSDQSDEAYCSCFSGLECYISPCPDNEFSCDSGTCIPKSWECDGDYDCADLSDEHKSCEHRSCSNLQFTCDNGYCIDRRLKCNGMNDCGDNSDEIVCNIRDVYISANKTNDCGKDYQCKDGHCIAHNLVCNDIKDCLDGSDEGGLCFSACGGDTNICDHQHHKTPSGCLCSCNNGYQLAGDGISCIDKLECTMDPPVCSQICTEEKGSYSCDCFQEFRLRYNNSTCKSKGTPMSIYFIVKNEIRQFIPSRHTLKVVHVDNSGDIVNLDVNAKEALLYFSVDDGNTLKCLNTQNSSLRSISNVGRTQNLALDWITNNVYFVKEQNSDNTIEMENTKGISNELQVCNFNQRHCAEIAKRDGSVSALEVDPVNKYIFYAVINENDCNIYRSSLDGRFPLMILTCYNISDMAVDYRHKHLYITNGTTISRLNYGSTAIGNLRLVNIINTDMHIKGLNIFEDHLYFLSDGGRSMVKCRLFGDSRRCTTFPLSANSIDRFVIVQTSRQTPGRNPCVTYNCSHLCVPSGNGARCLCENGTFVDENNDCRV